MEHSSHTILNGIMESSQKNAPNKKNNKKKKVNKTKSTNQY